MCTRTLIIVAILIVSSCVIIRANHTANMRIEEQRHRAEIQAILFGERPNFTQCVILNQPQNPSKLKRQNQTITENSFWTVEIYKHRTISQCSGSLIHRKVILTAAHCLQNATSSQLHVLAKNYHQYQQRQVQSIVRHDAFNSTHPIHDIALIFLNKPFQLSFGLTTVCLLKRRINLSYVQCTATETRKLREQSNLPLIPFQRCEAILRTTDLGSSFNLNKGFICADRGGYDWMLDGGVPLTCSICGSPGQVVQVGIMSWGFNKLLPHVLTSVNEYHNWIVGKIKEKRLKLPNCNYRKRTVKKQLAVRPVTGFNNF